MWAYRPREGGSEFGFTLRVLEADELDDDEPEGRPRTSWPVRFAGRQRRSRADSREPTPARE